MMRILKQIFRVIFLISIVMGIGIKSVYATHTATDKPINILFVDENNNNALDGHEVLLVMSAADYKKVFKDRVPLERMLRGQIEKDEYIALNNRNIMKMDKNKDSTLTVADGKQVYRIYFATVSGTIQDSYIMTLAKKRHMGKFKAIVLHMNKKDGTVEHTLHFQEGHKHSIRAAPEHSHVGL